MTYFFVWDQDSLVDHRVQDYKCLCTAVTICATLFSPKFDLSILIPLTSKSRSSSKFLWGPIPKKSLHSVLLPTNARHVLKFRKDLFRTKTGQADDDFGGWVKGQSYF